MIMIWKTLSTEESTRTTQTTTTVFKELTLNNSRIIRKVTKLSSSGLNSSNSNTITAMVSITSSSSIELQS